jgi:O-antigen/teichoic acid export membrane protein
MIKDEIKFLLTHSSIFGLGTVVSQVVAFFMLPLYTRYLTPSDYGMLEIIGISNGIIGIVVTVGIAMALSRFYYEPDSEKGKNTVVSTTYITYVSIAVLFIPILFIVSTPLSVLLFETKDYGYYFRISFTTLCIGGIFDIGMMYLRLLKKSVVYISITITRLILLISLNIYFIVVLHLGVLGILYSALIVRCLMTLIITASILWKIGLRFKIDLAKSMLKYSLPIIPSKLSNTLIKQADKYFVLYFLSLADMGIYSLALKMGNVIHTLLTVPFTMAYMPRRFETIKMDGSRDNYAKIFTYYIFIVGYIGLAISLLIPEILKLMVASSFFEAAKIVPLVVFSMIIYGSHMHFNLGILVSKKTKYMAYINLASAAVSLTGNLVLIFLFGLWGAVLSSIIALTFEAVLLYRTSNKLYKIPFQFARVFKYLSVAVLFYIVLQGLRFNMGYWYIAVKLGGLCIFPIVLIWLKIITPDEMNEIKRIYVTRVKMKIMKRTVQKGVS